MIRPLPQDGERARLGRFLILQRHIQRQQHIQQRLNIGTDQRRALETQPRILETLRALALPDTPLDHLRKIAILPLVCLDQARQHLGLDRADIILLDHDHRQHRQRHRRNIGFFRHLLQQHAGARKIAPYQVERRPVLAKLASRRTGLFANLQDRARFVHDAALQRQTCQAGDREGVLGIACKRLLIFGGALLEIAAHFVERGHHRGKGRALLFVLLHGVRAAQAGQHRPGAARQGPLPAHAHEQFDIAHIPVVTAERPERVAVFAALHLVAKLALDRLFHLGVHPARHRVKEIQQGADVVGINLTRLAVRLKGRFRPAQVIEGDPRIVRDKRHVA